MMRLKEPLSPALSPFHGEREKPPSAQARSLNGEQRLKGVSVPSPHAVGRGSGRGVGACWRVTALLRRVSHVLCAICVCNLELPWTTCGAEVLAGSPGFGRHGSEVIQADICIYGGTAGGVAAAVQASRMGK